MRFVALTIILTTAACSSGGDADPVASPDAASSETRLPPSDAADETTSPPSDSAIITDSSIVTTDADAPDTASAPDGSTGDAMDASTDSSIVTTDAKVDSAPDAAPVVIGPGGATCATANVIPLSSGKRLTLPANTSTATHTLDAACASDTGAAVFYSIALSKPAFVYADTFGSSVDSILFLLDKTCAPLPTTMSGDATCNDDACAASQSRVVALLSPGHYVLGVAGKGAATGAIDVHFEWAFAPSGTVTQLPKGASTMTGTTSGSSGNIGALGSCLGAGPENSYWWTSCPSDPAGTLKASTCGGATWETVLQVQIPASKPTYACTIDSCGLQSQIAQPVPAGAGLRVLSIDGEAGSDSGKYTMTVERP